MLANSCALCKDVSKSIDHILLHCDKARNLMAAGILHFLYLVGYI